MHSGTKHPAVSLGQKISSKYERRRPLGFTSIWMFRADTYETRSCRTVCPLFSALVLLYRLPQGLVHLLRASPLSNLESMLSYLNALTFRQCKLTKSLIQSRTTLAADRAVPQSLPQTTIRPPSGPESACRPHGSSSCLRRPPSVYSPHARPKTRRRKPVHRQR